MHGATHRVVTVVTVVWGGELIRFIKQLNIFKQVSYGIPKIDLEARLPVNDSRKQLQSQVALYGFAPPLPMAMK